MMGDRQQVCMYCIALLWSLVLTQSSEFLMCCLALAISAARLLLGWRFLDAEDELE